MGFIDQLKLMWRLNPQRVNKLFLFILEHTEKRCSYCGNIYGQGLDIPIMDIVKHMADAHPEKTDIDEVRKYLKSLSQ
ncbi:hypothetical protein HYT26_02505 [Candidatus Pacearchaeota archaeon]|nr:hypothetical protein [Candidatus Pacearchaeota archaeon]